MKSINYIFLLIFLLILVTSCKKEIEGCTDNKAKNYNSEATIGAGECNYQASGHYYISMYRYNQLVASNINYLEPIIEGKSMGVIALSSLTPDQTTSCESSLSFTFYWTELGVNETDFSNASISSELHGYETYNSSQYIILNDYLLYEGGTCFEYIIN